MIIILQYLISIFTGYKILNTNGWQRLAWYFSSITLVSTAFNFYSGIAFTKSHLFFISLFIVSIIKEGKFKRRYLIGNPLSSSLLFLFISYILIGIFDERLGILLGVYRGILNYATHFGAFFIGWISTYEKINYKKLIRFICTLSLIFTIYGIYTFVTKSNPVIDALGFVDRFNFERANASFREFLVSGFLMESGVYGLSCFIFLIFLWAIKGKHNYIQNFTFVLLFINIFLTGTRSIMIPSILGIIVFITVNYNIKKKVKYLLTGIFASLIVLVIFPDTVGRYCGEIITSIIDVISPEGSGGADLGGSSIEARDMQITAAFMKYLPEKPLFGHGFNYFAEVILMKNQGVNDSELLGMESYLCFLGVEYGLVNIIAVVTFFTSLIVYTIKNRHVNKTLYSMLLSITITYIVYLITAYMGNSWLYAMPAIGFLVGNIEQLKRKQAQSRINL